MAGNFFEKLAELSRIAPNCVVGRATLQGTSLNREYVHSRSAAFWTFHRSTHYQLVPLEQDAIAPPAYLLLYTFSKNPSSSSFLSQLESTIRSALTDPTLGF